MKVLMISKYGDGADILLRIKSEGNDVRLWIEDKESDDVYDGLIDKVKAWQPSVTWSDLIIFDTNKLPHIWKQVYKRKPTFGGQEFSVKLEHDRKFAHDIMDSVGLKKIESLSFKKIDDVIDHVEIHKKQHVIKPIGKDVESEDVIVSDMKDGSDSIFRLQRLKETKKNIESFEVEEKKFGIEVGVSAFFNGNDWIYPININFEHKKFATGNLGFLTGEMGTAMVYDFNRDNKLFKSTLDKVKPVLQKNDFYGQIDLNMIINEEGNWPLEFTPRLGYPSIFIEDELQNTPWSEVLWKVSNSEPFENKVSSDWAMGVVVVLFGFPFRKEYMERSFESPIFGVSEKNIEHIHLVESKISDDKFVSSKGFGYPLVVTGRGKTLEEAKSNTYFHLNKKNQDKIVIPNSWWRTDIGDRVINRRKDLESLGILPK